MLDVHHIVCDRHSIRLLIEDLKNLLNGMELAPSEVSYVDFSAWQRNLLNNEKALVQFWMNQGLEEVPRITFSGDPSYALDQQVITRTLQIKNEGYVRATELMKEWEVSPFMFFLTVQYILINQIAGNEEIIIGTDVLGRNHRNLDRIVGTFVNILPLKVSLDASDPVESVVHQVRESVLGCFDHQDIQFDEIVKLAGAGGTNTDKLVQVHFAFTEYEEEILNGVEAGGIRMRPIKLPVEPTTQYEFKIDGVDLGNAFELEFFFDPSVFGVADSEILYEYYERILNAILFADARQVADTMMITEKLVSV